METPMTSKPIIEFEQGWSLVNTEIQKVLTILQGGGSEEPITPDDYMKIYTIIYDMCTQLQAQDYAPKLHDQNNEPADDPSELLYEKYKEVFDNHCINTILPSLVEKHGEFLLREFVDRWSSLKTMIRWMHHFFNYLDRFYTYRKNKPELKKAPVDSFRDLVYKEIKVRVRDAVVECIRREREGDQLDRALLKNVLDIFVAMGTTPWNPLEFYEGDFEEAMLGDTAGYYARNASRWIGEDSCPEYMIKAEECLRREKERASHYLHASSEVKLLGKAEHELLSVHRNRLLENEHSGCRALLRDGKVDDLSRMYRLFVRVPDDLVSVASMFKEHVTAEGTALVKQAEEAAKNRKPGKIDTSNSHEQVFIENVIQLHDKFLGYVNDYFLKDTLFDKAFKDAFEVFCNKQIAESSSAEILSIFCDNIMKKAGSEKAPDEVIEETFDKVVTVLAYFSDKDLFAEFYQKKLVRRLIIDRTAIDEYERSLLTKLKHRYGAQFTSRMEGMIKDLTLSRDFQHDFEAYLKQNHHGIDVAVSVLTTGFWPTYKSSDLNLPAEMVKCVETFNEFYESKTTKRKLTWIHSLGSCIITGKFEAKNIELMVTTYQAALLLLFNHSDRLSYLEIKNQLNLPDKEVTKLLHSLSCGKYRILNKEPNTKNILPADTFEFNFKFTDKMRRIKIQLPSAEDKKKVIQAVDKGRRHIIDASIVRIMKSRKVLGHQQLVLECVEHLSKSFKPDFKLIKSRIDDLISREFLERDPDNFNGYRYLA